MRLSLLVILAFFSKSLAAQSRFIEVNVADTVIANADLFIYQITMSAEADKFTEMRYTDPVVYRKQMEINDKKKQKLFDSVVTGLTKNGFTCLAPNVMDKFLIVSDPEQNNRAIDVVLKSVAALDSLYMHLQTINNITGNVIITKAQDEESYQKALLQN